MRSPPALPGGRIVTRFAPSPTGPLHLGHAFAALIARDLARAGGGTYLLRIEDIDRQRSKPEWEAQLLEDLAWLGLAPDAPPMRQSERLPAYRAALGRLWGMGLLYPCTCSRRDIEAAMGAPQEGAPPNGPDGPLYPGTCRPPAPLPGPCPEGVHLRLDMARAVDFLSPGGGGGNVAFEESGPFGGNRAAEGSGSVPENGSVPGPGPLGGPAPSQNDQFPQQVYDPRQLVQRIGDVVLARKDFGTSYHLSVVVDDAAQGVTLVSRGADLFEATPIHVLLQRLLELPTPAYHHHALVRDAAGKRLAKRDDARAIARYREDGLTPAEVLELARQGAAMAPGRT